MWKYPWGLKEGYVINAGLFTTGILLQLSIGQFKVEFLSFPVNVVCGLIFILLLILLSVLSQIMILSVNLRLLFQSI